VGIAAATCSVGPLRVFRNVMATSRRAPGKADRPSSRGVFAKLGDKGSHGTGRQYWFHNTVLQPTLGMASRSGFASILVWISVGLWPACQGAGPSSCVCGSRRCDGR